MSRVRARADERLLHTGPGVTLGHRMLDDIFLSCLREPDLEISTGPLQTVQQKDDRALLGEQAQRHGLLGILCAQAHSLGWDVDDVASPRDRLNNVGNNLRLHAELLAVGRTLQGAGIAWLTFKGPVLAASVYPRIDMRSYSDVDLLISPDDLPQALEVFGAAGYRMVSEPWAELRRTRRAQLPLTTPKGVAVDLHWNVFNSPGVRAAFPVPTGALLDRRVAVSTTLGDLWTLTPADTLVHLAAHGAASGGARLIWVLDVHLAAGKITDWAEVTATARAWDLGLVTAVMLARSQHLLGTQLPAGLLNELSGSSPWLWGMELLDRARPPHRHSLGTGQTLFTSTRATGAESLKHLARATIQESLIPLVRASDHPWRVALRGRRSPQPVVLPHAPIGHRSLTAADPDRDAFLDFVAEEFLETVGSQPRA